MEKVGLINGYFEFLVDSSPSITKASHIDLMNFCSLASDVSN